MIEIIKGNIINANTEAIVNAANEDLILGAGVAGAIHEHGGSSIQEECNKLSPIKTGEAVTTHAGNLPQNYVIHAVAPCGEVTGWQDLMKKCICSILEEAEKIKVSSVAIPAVGTGIFGLPTETVAKIMIQNVKERESQLKYLKKVVFVLFDDTSYRIFKNILGNI
jgi:O-acetyl-ADP-ribose deacetylase (regulator of RNase III)